MIPHAEEVVQLAMGEVGGYFLNRRRSVQQPGQAAGGPRDYGDAAGSGEVRDEEFSASGVAQWRARWRELEFSAEVAIIWRDETRLRPASRAVTSPPGCSTGKA